MDRPKGGFFRTSETKDGLAGNWLTRKDPRLMSKVDYANQHAIPAGVEGLEWIGELEIPAGVTLRGSFCGANAFGTGGKFQWEVINEVPQGTWIRRASKW